MPARSSRGRRTPRRPTPVLRRARTAGSGGERVTRSRTGCRARPEGPRGRRPERAPRAGHAPAAPPGDRRRRSGSEHFVEPLAGGAVLLSHELRVAAGGDADVGVAEALLHHLVVADNNPSDGLRCVPPPFGVIRGTPGSSMSTSIVAAKVTRVDPAVEWCRERQDLVQARAPWRASSLRPQGGADRCLRHCGGR